MTTLRLDLRHARDHAATAQQKKLLARIVKGQVLGETIFDVHTHTCDGWSQCSIYDGSAEGLHREMDAMGFTGMACSAVCAISGLDFKKANDSLARDILRKGNRIAAYVGVDIRQGKNLIPAIHRYVGDGFSGGKIYTRWGVPYDDERYHPVFDIFNQLNWPVLAHTWGATDVRQLANAAKKFPKINFIAAHTGSADVPVYVELAGSVENLFIDTAYSRGHRDLIETVVRSIGSRKLCFGSDSALFSAGQQVARVVAARISDEDRRNILGRNALRLFKGVKPR